MIAFRPRVRSYFSHLRSEPRAAKPSMNFGESAIPGEGRYDVLKVSQAGRGAEVPESMG